MDTKKYSLNEKFSELSELSLDVSEIFHSIQGESSYAGLCCSFIRLAGCNLRCSYCDTKYALTRENSVKISISDIVRKIHSLKTDLVEITGGEPLEQKNVFPLMDLLAADGFQVLLETNGSYSIKNIPAEVSVIMDCKCPSSGESEKMNFENFLYLKSGSEVKFVIADRADYKYAVGIIDKYKLADKDIEILFSAVGGGGECRFAGKLADWIAADRLPVRFQLQIHKIIWNDAKGK